MAFVVGAVLASFSGQSSRPSGSISPSCNVGVDHHPGRGDSRWDGKYHWSHRRSPVLIGVLGGPKQPGLYKVQPVQIVDLRGATRLDDAETARVGSERSTNTRTPPRRVPAGRMAQR